MGVAAENPPPAPANGNAEKAMQDFAKGDAAHAQGREAAASYHYEMGKKALAENRVIDAVEHFTKAVDYQSDNQQYRQALAEAQGIAGQTRGARDVYVNQVADELSVNQQRLWAEAQTHVEEGNKHLEAGDYAEAERSFTLARTRLESLPYADERKGPEMRRVETLVAETRQRRAKQELQEAGDRNRTAEDRQREIRATSLRNERTMIEAMFNRAEKARQRRDYDEAIAYLEQILKINRAYEPAHDLLVRCRRERHVYLRQVTADRWDEEHKLLSEQIRTAMLPQMEILAYSHDWPEIDARRGAPKQGLDEENEAWRLAINNQLEQPVTLTFSETDLSEVIAFLQRMTQINFVVDPTILASPPLVTLNVRDMKVRYVLDFIKQQTKDAYSIRDEAVYISTAEGVRGDLYMHVYNIRDLMLGLTNFPGPDLDIPKDAGTGTRLLPPVADTAPPEINEFIDIIKKVVAPDSWNDTAGTSIQEFQGAMVINQSAEVHKQIDMLLRSLRAERGTQIHVKVKFLTVENSLLEEIGVDWRNFAGGVQPPGAPAVPPNATTGSPGPIGVYNANDPYTVAGVLNNRLQGYNTAHSLPLPQPNEGMTIHAETFHFANGLFASAVLHAVEKERRGNIVFEPDVTLFNGQQAHVLHVNQQSYISDYTASQDQMEPVVSVLSYGTVLDVQAVASADRKYITLTLRPTNAQVRRWRRFGPPITDPNNTFPGGDVIQPAQANLQSIGGSPLMLPELDYQSVRTSVTIPDGGSLLIAGMTNGESARSHAGIPFLSHIPFLGRLFSSNGRQETEIRTLIMVSADIVIFDEIEKKL